MENKVAEKVAAAKAALVARCVARASAAVGQRVQGVLQMVAKVENKVAGRVAAAKAALVARCVAKASAAVVQRVHGVLQEMQEEAGRRWQDRCSEIEAKVREVEEEKVLRELLSKHVASCLKEAEEVVGQRHKDTRKSAAHKKCTCKCGEPLRQRESVAEEAVKE